MRVGGADARGLPEGRERGCAAHEAQMVALDRGGQSEIAHEAIVGSRGEEPGARGGDDVRDGGCLDIRSRQRFACSPGEERRRLATVHVVARSRQGRAELTGIRVDEVGRSRGLLSELAQHRMPGIDRGLVERRADQACGQPVDTGLRQEQVAHGGLGQDGGRHSGADAEDVGGHVSE